MVTARGCSSEDWVVSWTLRNARPAVQPVLVAWRWGESGKWKGDKDVLPADVGVSDVSRVVIMIRPSFHLFPRLQDIKEGFISGAA